MKKSLAAQVIGQLPSLTPTGRSLLSYLLGWFLDEDKGYCEASQIQIAKWLIRRNGLDSTPETYRKTVNTYLKRLIALAIVEKADGGPGRVLRLVPGKPLREAIRKVREGWAADDTPPEEQKCPCCGHLFGRLSAGSMAGVSAGCRQDPMKGTMEPTPEPSSLTTNSVSESERDDLLDAIIAAITALAIVKKAEPIRNHLAYRKTLAKNSIEELRESAAQLQRVLDGEGKPRTLTQNEIAEQECESENTSQADCAEDFFRDAAILDDAEEIGRAYFDTLPESTRDTLVNEEITAHLASPQKSTWLRWDKSFQVQEAERILAQRFGLQIIDYPDSKPYDPEKTEIKKPRLSLNFFDHGAGRLPVEVQNGF